jgi:hypothetical protein
MPEHRQPECRFGDEDVARHHFERRAGRIPRVLVVAGGDNAGILAGNRDLRRAQHMTGGVEFHLDVAEPYLFAVRNRLRVACKIVAVAQPHHVERFPGGQHRAMAGPGVVGMAMGDDGTFDRPDRIDVKTAGLAAQTGGSWQQDVLRAHVRYIRALQLIFTRPGPHARPSIHVLRRSRCRPPL